MVNGKSNVYDGVCVIYVGTFMTIEDDWAEQAKRIVRAEMVRRGVTYETLAERLAALGVHDTPVNMRNKIARGKFAPAFMLQVLESIGCKAFNIKNT
jgi:hypothetical protein